MFGKEKKDSGNEFAWYWKGKSAKKHMKDDNMMTNAVQERRRAGNNAPGRGFLRMSVPPGLPIRRRNELGPGFWSGENVDRQLQRQELQCRPRDIHPSPGRPPPACSPPHCLPPIANRHDGPGMDMQPNRPPPDRHPARHRAPAPRQRPLNRQEHPPCIHPRSRHREFALCGLRDSPFMFPPPDIDDDCYSVSSGGDSTDSEDSDWESTWGEPFFPNRFDSSPFHHQGRRRGRLGSYSDDTIRADYLSDDTLDFADRHRRARRFDRMGGDHHVRGRAPRRRDFGPGFSGLRATSSESRRGWFCP